jgi:hypothetical protein
LAISLVYSSGEEGDTVLVKLFLLAFTAPREKGEGSAPCGSIFPGFYFTLLNKCDTRSLHEGLLADK